MDSESVMRPIVHIPDGFIAPQVYVPAAAVAAGCWAAAIRRARRELEESLLPQLSVLTALAFVLSSIALPVVGGTSVHASGVAMLAVCFGPHLAFLAISLVLLLQAFLFGAGGITSFPVNALAMGLAGAYLAWGAFALLRTRSLTAALVAAGWISVVVPAVLLAVVLGVQPLLAHTAGGEPLFFPFGLRVTLPALLIPHLLMGVAEGVLTVLVYRLVTRMNLARRA